MQQRQVAAVLAAWGLLAGATGAAGLPRECPAPTRQHAADALASGRFEGAVHGLESPSSPQDEVRRAVALEQTGRLDAAGKAWQALLKTTAGDVRIRLERRINALAETEVALAHAAAGQRKPAAERRRSASFDLEAQAQGPAWPAWLDDPAALSTLLGALPVPPLAAAQAPDVVRRLLGGPEDEEPVGAAWPAEGGPVVAARVFVGGDVRLRAWVVDDRTGRRKGELTTGTLPNGEPVQVLGVQAFQAGWVAFGAATAAPEGGSAWVLHVGGSLRPKWQAYLLGQAVHAAWSPGPGVLLLAGTAPDGGLRLWQLDGTGRVAWQADRPELKPTGAPEALRWVPGKRGRARLEGAAVGALEVVPGKGGWQVKPLQAPGRWKPPRPTPRPAALAKLAGPQAVWVKSPDGLLLLGV